MGTSPTMAFLQLVFSGRLPLGLKAHSYSLVALARVSSLNLRDSLLKQSRLVAVL